LGASFALLDAAFGLDCEGRTGSHALSSRGSAGEAAQGGNSGPAMASMRRERRLRCA
jgi:hypothetical protein